MTDEELLKFAKRLLFLEGSLQHRDRRGNHILIAAPPTMKTILGDGEYARITERKPRYFDVLETQDVIESARFDGAK